MDNNEDFSYMPWMAYRLERWKTLTNVETATPYASANRTFYNIAYPVEGSVSCVVKVTCSDSDQFSGEVNFSGSEISLRLPKSLFLDLSSSPENFENLMFSYVSTDRDGESQSPPFNIFELRFLSKNFGKFVKTLKKQYSTTSIFAEIEKL